MHTVTLRIFVFSSIFLLSKTPLSAQTLAPTQNPLHLTLGYSNENGTILYSGVSYDLEIKRRIPILQPHVLQFYTEDGAFVSLNSHSEGDYRPNQLSRYHGNGVAVVWKLPEKTQVGLGLGQYRASTDGYSFLNYIPAQKVSGWGGKAFVCVTTSKRNFMDIALTIPGDKRFSMLQLGFGVRL
jgi:hypothetical protein